MHLVKPKMVDDHQPALTLCERVGDVWLKRDDTFSVAGVRGGKVRTCWRLAMGSTGLITAGSRASPQVNIVAHVARRLGVPCRVHTPTGGLSPEVQAAEGCGAQVIQHKAGYNNVIVARAREDAQRLGWTEIPFGMECWEAVKQTSSQIANIPLDAGRLVVPVGSGMSLAGIVMGLREAGRALPILGVQVGADPTKRLDKYAPGWRRSVQLVSSGLDYHKAATRVHIGGVLLDPIYEAKCIPFLRPNDVLWCVGIRATA
jgi:1-aminocyclopropane-1-carboxylate deaminase/D-cysteine desulfhydrase-like pyridoxal-dependent ACC family enzyme